MNPVTVDDIETAFRPLSTLETVRALDLLGDAWEELLVRVPTLEERQAAGAVSVGLVRRVVKAMVIRVLRNPDAIQRWSIDDASFTRDAMVSAGMLFVSADEAALLAGVPVGPLPPLSGSIPYGRSW